MDYRIEVITLPVSPNLAGLRPGRVARLTSEPLAGLAMMVGQEWLAVL
jgi:hypothetical protein